MEFISSGDNCVSSLIGLGWVIWFNCKGCVLEMKNGICRKWNQIRKAPHGLELRLELLKWRTCCDILQFLPFGSFLSERALSFRKTERESSEQLRPPLRKWSMSLRGRALCPPALFPSCLLFAEWMLLEFCSLLLLLQKMISRKVLVGSLVCLGVIAVALWEEFAGQLGHTCAHSVIKLTGHKNESCAFCGKPLFEL